MRMPEVCFGPAKTRKEFEFSEINICLWHGAQKLLRHKLLKLDAASLLLRYIDRYSCLCCWNEFFQLCFRFCTEVFSNCIFQKTFAIGFQKGFDHKRIEFGVFFFEFWLNLLILGSEWTANFKKCWNLCLIWRHEVFSITSLRVIPVCCSNMLVLFSHINIIL